jgi:hypothetical protein
MSERLSRRLVVAATVSKGTPSAVFHLNGDLGLGAHMDHHIGRLISAIDELSKLDKTLIFYIASDNGRSAEGVLAGIFNETTSFHVVVGKVKHILKFD